MILVHPELLRTDRCKAVLFIAIFADCDGPTARRLLRDAETRQAAPNRAAS